MSNQYEVEHDIKPAPETERETRRIDMSTFINLLNRITPEPSASAASDSPSTAASSARRIFNTPTPRDWSSLFRLVQEQMAALFRTAPTGDNRDLLRNLVESLSPDVDAPPAHFPGVSAEFVDGLDRAPRKSLRAGDCCPICAERFLDDPYPLVVVLPCHPSHRFDLECVQPWLRAKGSCPMCRKEFGPKEPVGKDGEGEGGSEDEDDVDGLYG